MKNPTVAVQTENRKSLRPQTVGRFPPASKNRLTRHRIYDCLLRHLANPRIRSIQTGQILPYLLHEKTKAALRSEFGYSAEDVAKIEAGIFADVERGLSGYEVVRDVPPILYSEFKKQGVEDLIFDKNIVPLPAPILNALICETMQKTFSRDELLACPGFIEVTDFDDDGNELTAIRLDVESYLSRRGFMLPVIRSGLIVALKVFRSPRDERPFLLKSRNLGVNV